VPTIGRPSCGIFFSKPRGSSRRPQLTDPVV